MSKILYFDCLSGISGDMSIAAMLNLGVEEEYLRSQLALLDFHEFSLEIKPDVRKGIAGTRFIVTSVHDHDHHHNHEHQHLHGHHHHRHLSDIQKIINDSTLSADVKELSLKIFEGIAIAEAKVHGSTKDKVHFHEVGAVDSIVDIVGFAICFCAIKPDRVYCSPINTGSGTVKCDHGIMPVPAPATAELLSGIPIYSAYVQKELTTPTGAAIARVVVDEFCDMPAMKISAIGYGLGTRDNDLPNVLRIIQAESESVSESLMLLETNIDDMSGELLGNCFDVLMNAGALDVFATPIIMKKNRPAYKLSVLCSQVKKAEIEEVIYRNTSTLGIREIKVNRSELERTTVTVSTQWGDVRIKQGWYNDELITNSPEFEDCKKIAEASGKTIKDIYGLVLQLYKN